MSRLFVCFWAAAPKGTKSCRTQGEFLSVRPFVRSSVRSSVPPRGLSQAQGGPSQVLGGPSQALEGQIQALGGPSQALGGQGQALEGLSQAWVGPT